MDSADTEEEILINNIFAQIVQIEGELGAIEQNFVLFMQMSTYLKYLKNAMKKRYSRSMPLV